MGAGHPGHTNQKDLKRINRVRVKLNMNLYNIGIGGVGAKHHSLPGETGTDHVISDHPLPTAESDVCQLRKKFESAAGNSINPKENEIVTPLTLHA